jgi:hypothetical protein
MEKKPGPHAEHTVLPRASLYVPAVQTAHVAFGRPKLRVKYPVLHLQSVDSVLPCVDVELPVHAIHVLAVVAAGVPEYVALPQIVHVAGPDAILYVPSRQASHVWPFGPEYPGLHVHAVCTLLPVDELEFDGQGLHIELADDPTAPEYVFTPQFVHVPTPDSGLYFPTPHKVQSDGPVPDDPALQVHNAKVPLPAGELEFDGQF